MYGSYIGSITAIITKNICWNQVLSRAIKSNVEWVIIQEYNRKKAWQFRDNMCEIKMSCWKLQRLFSWCFRWGGRGDCTSERPAYAAKSQPEQPTLKCDLKKFRSIYLKKFSEFSWIYIKWLPWKPLAVMNISTCIMYMKAFSFTHIQI